MAASPFAFLRGSAIVMANDLAGAPSSGITVQASGDCHIMNFGLFGTPERNLVFGLNDFDETLPGPWEWDVKRLAASAMVAARYVGFGDDVGREAARAAAENYRLRIDEYSRLGSLELWYANLPFDKILEAAPAAQRKGAEAIAAKARTRTNLQVLGKMTDVVSGDFRLIEDPPLVQRLQGALDQQSIEETLSLWLSGYRTSLPNDRRRLLDAYTIVDVVRKVVGVGSVGTRCFVVLLKGRDESDPLFLQVKEAQASVMEPFIGRSALGTHGRRVVEGQRLLQGAPDIFLGWGRLELPTGNLDYYVRQLRDMKGGVTLEPGAGRPDGLVIYARLCARALALAHARSGDAAAIAGYLGTTDQFDRAIESFSATYADQTERDHALLKAAIESGRVPAVADGGI